VRCTAEAGSIKKSRARGALALQNFYTGEQGFEPQQADPESAVLPLDDSPLTPDILAFSDRMSKLSRNPGSVPPAARD
jgi:hypothetical protein